MVFILCIWISTLVEKQDLGAWPFIHDETDIALLAPVKQSMSWHGRIVFVFPPFPRLL
jgi:hypothetical protein